ncbi:hypothetical protein [Spongiimicrobium salis]|uniref:hypothetical protein n=1 Tax=Spongiimicrobium salis TaxID=1667022 RepID=UPI00374CB179
MKQIMRSAALAAMIILASCSKDDTNAPNDPEGEEVTQLESTPLEANMVSDNVVIPGGTKNTGELPTPNNGISLDLSNAKGTAYLNEGFSIPLSSDGEVVGAYIQFKTNDGSAADSYYDIDVAANAPSNTFKKSFRSFGKKERNLAAKTDDLTLDVDFGTQIPPGTFCYELCVYDAEGNISAPQEICVTVESWGGNNALVGEWNIVRQEENYEGMDRVVIPGEESCDSFSLFCQSQEELSVDDCETLESGILIFRADGTYSYTETSRETELNYGASEEACEAIYKDEVTEVYTSTGFWAFVGNESRLTIVEYEYSENENGEVVYSDTYEPGEGELLFDGMINVNGNAFNISEEFDFDGDGVADETFAIFFEK